jgi:hypothetical protein
MRATGLAKPDEGTRQDRLAARRWLRVLDACLYALEDASERGETVVPERLVAKLSMHVRGLHAGMSTADALDRVFQQQQVAMLGCHGPDCFTEAEARALTDRIKSGVGQASLLLLEAHKRRVWAVLGYRTWETYVRQEFGLSRTRSYELVYHGEVIREIQAATGMFGIPNITPYVALQVRANLEEVTEALKVRTRNARSEAESAAVVAEVLEHLRARLARHRSTRPSPASPEDRKANVDAGELAGAGQRLDIVDRRRLLDAIRYLAAMPAVREVIAQIEAGDEEDSLLARRAAQWLSEFAETWTETPNQEGRLLRSAAS